MGTKMLTQPAPAKRKSLSLIAYHGCDLCPAGRRFCLSIAIPLFQRFSVDFSTCVAHEERFTMKKIDARQLIRIWIKIARRPQQAQKEIPIVLT